MRLEEPSKLPQGAPVFRYTPRVVEVLSLCPFRAGALAWQSAPDAWSLTVVVKATFTIVDGGEATLAPVQSPVAAFAGDTDTAIEDLSPLKPKVDVLVLRGSNEDSATVEVSSILVPARGPIPPFAPARRLLLQEQGLEWAASVLRGEAAAAGPAPPGFDFGFFHVASREQRIDLLRSGSPLVLTKVFPGKDRVVTTLPQRKPQAFRVHPETGKASEIILRCDTVCIDAARNLVVLTFRGIADVDSGNQGNAGTIVVAAHSAGKKIRADRIERFLRNGDPIEGEANDGRHPLEKRYDTVLAAPKGGDTVALPDMDGSSGSWPAAEPNHHDSGMMRAPGGLPFQARPSEAPPPPIPPAPLHVAGGGRRLATWSAPLEPQRGPDMPFQGALPPPVPEPYLPPPPPEGIFPEPPAMLPVITPEAPPLIRPPPMLGASFAQDEKTADLPPGHENMDEATVDLPPRAAAAMRSEVPPPVVESSPATPATAPGLAGKSIPLPGKAPVAAPAAPKGAPLKAPAAPKPAIAAPAAPKLPTSPAAPKPGAIAAPKPGAAAAPKPASTGAIAPKPGLPTGPIKVPAPLGPKLNTTGPAKPGAAASTAEQKPAAAVGTKPSAASGDKPVAQAKPAAGAFRPAATTVPFPSLIKPGTVAAPAVAAVAAPAVVSAKPPVLEEPFDAARALKLEECAALDAELRHRPGTKKALLEKHKLSEENWLAVHKHWADAIARQTEVGERKLLLAYDAAYVGAQEKLGIRVGIDTHAKLQVAAERGTTSAVLQECGLEPADQMRLGRVWTQRLADDPARMKELAIAIEKARSS